VVRAGAKSRIQPTGYRFTDRHMLVNAGKAVDVGATSIRIFIFLGQSNMVGHARADELPGELLEPDPRVLRLEDHGWVVQRADKKRNGPEISFGRRMAHAWPGETIGIIKIALDGTGIRAFLPDWSHDVAEISPGDGSKGPLYRILKRRVDLARRLGPVEFCAVFWKQGGTDMLLQRTAEGYTEHLGRIIGAIRNDTGERRLPLLVGTYTTIDGIDELFGSPEYMRIAHRVEAAREVITAHNKAREVIPYTSTVVHGGLPTRDAVGHFTTEGQILLGRIFADSYLDIQH
jgi:hypothetical protein